ncbi:MAG: hypothetical protein EOL95_09770 [Bacteroidia bacterium]|nr:hypothetical protein [Bacteroidia bacterium]
MSEGSFSPRILGQTIGISIQAAKALTASYANFGSEIDVRGYTTLGVWVTADVNLSTNVNLKANAYHTSGGTAYELETNGTKALWTTGASDFTKLYEFDVSSINYIQLQAIAGTVGATAGTLAITITKSGK